MTALYEKARDAYRALCELKDELDAFADVPSERERLELGTVDRRWNHDTRRKISTALARRRSA